MCTSDDSRPGDSEFCVAQSKQRRALFQALPAPLNAYFSLSAADLQFLPVIKLLHEYKPFESSEAFQQLNT